MHCISCYLSKGRLPRRGKCPYRGQKGGDPEVIHSLSVPLFGYEYTTSFSTVKARVPTIG